MFELPPPVMHVVADGRVLPPGPEVANKGLQVSVVSATDGSPTRAFSGNTTVPFRHLETSMQFRPQIVCEVEGCAGVVNATNCGPSSIVGAEGRGIRSLASHSKLNAGSGSALALLVHMFVLTQAVPQCGSITFDDHIYVFFIDVHGHFEDREIIRVIRHDVIIPVVEETAVGGRSQYEPYQSRS